MDTKKLAILLETVRIGSMKKAAEKFGYAQAGILYLMNTIENEVGMRLLNRSHKGVSWNKSGSELEPYFNRLIEASTAMESKIAALTESASKQICIGVYPSIAFHLIPRAISIFLQEYPDVEINLRVGTSEVPRWLEEGEIYIAIMQEGRVDGYKWVPLMSIPTYAALPATYSLKNLNSITLEDLAQFPILFPTYNTEDNATRVLSSMPIAKKITVSTADGIALLRMVAQGLGATCITSTYLSECPEGVIMLPLNPPVIRNFGAAITYAGAANPTVENFVRHLVDYCKENYSPPI